MKNFIGALFALMLGIAPFSAYAVDDIDATTPFNAGKNWEAMKDTILPKIDDAPISVNLENISGASSAYAPGTVTGKLVKVLVAVLGSVTGADATLDVEVNGVDVGTITVGTSLVEGGVIEYTPTVIAAVTPGSSLEIGTDGASTGDVDATVVFKVQRYP